MKKQQRQLFVLVGVLVVLLCAFLGLRQYNKAQADKPVEKDEKILVIDAAAEDVTQLAYNYEGEDCTFEKEEDTWYAAQDHSLNIKQTRITSMVNGIAPLEASQVIENVTDLAQYGLTEPQKTITVETAAKSYILYVGDKNDLTSSYYVCFPSTSTVYVVSATDINRFNYGYDELVEEETETSEEASASPDMVQNRVRIVDVADALGLSTATVSVRLLHRARL